MAGRLITSMPFGRGAFLRVAIKNDGSTINERWTLQREVTSCPLRETIPILRPPQTWVI